MPVSITVFMVYVIRFTIAQLWKKVKSKRCKHYNSKILPYIYSVGCPADDAAGNFSTGAPRGLCGEIIWVVMDDNHISKNLIHKKAVCQKSG